PTPFASRLGSTALPHPRSWMYSGVTGSLPITNRRRRSMHTTLTEPLFRPISTAIDALIDVEFDGHPLKVLGDCSVAAALLAAGVSRFRSTPVSGAPRGPYCMMGVCFECL